MAYQHSPNARIVLIPRENVEGVELHKGSKRLSSHCKRKKTNKIASLQNISSGVYVSH